jgi:charged multivesicular body protein 5
MQYDMEELLEQANEVQETLSRSYAVPDEIDEADLEAGPPPLSTLISSAHD